VYRGSPARGSPARAGPPGELCAARRCPGAGAEAWGRSGGAWFCTSKRARQGSGRSAHRTALVLSGCVIGRMPSQSSVSRLWRAWSPRAPGSRQDPVDQPTRVSTCVVASLQLSYESGGSKQADSGIHRGQ
jgi:hypothetical protein